MMLVSRSRCQAGGALVSGMLLLAGGVGCQGSRMDGPVRAVWVTRGDYKTAEHVKQIMADCSEAGFNTVIFQVRGNGTAFYQSELEPWAEQFGYEDPGFDPLALACAESHARNMELHAWVNVMPAWRGPKPPDCAEQLYHTRPEWFWYDQNGDRQALSWFYVSLNPCLPEVRDYLVDVFREIVANYDVDGLHLDYIRFPSEPPATPKGSGLDYPRDERTLALYKEATGLTPDEDEAAWDQWRTDQVTQLVAEIRDMMRATDPAAALSACGGSNRERSLEHHRDGKTWAERGLVDAIFAMNYKPDLPKFEEGLAMWLPPEPDVTVVPGLWFGRQNSGEEGIEVVGQQIEYALATTGNVCIFSYSSLFEIGGGGLPKPGVDEEKSARAAERRALREARRTALLPLIKLDDD